MKNWIVAFLAAFVAGAAAQSCASCSSMKWASCDGNPCVCTLILSDAMPQTVDCQTLVPKCFLMKAESFRARKGLGTRSIGGKPVESAFVDNDGIYDPDCEKNGRFKARQCNGTEECWCVNSAGARRTDKGDKTLKCDKLVETYWIRLQLTHKPVATKLDATSLKSSITNTIRSRYMPLDPSMVKSVQYDPDARMIVVDVEKPKGNSDIDLATMAYYMEKDVKVLPLFSKEDIFKLSTNNQTVGMENILVYYVDEEPPTFTMKNLSGGIIAVIVVVVLAVVAGLLILFFNRKRLTKYNKAQPREMDNM